MKLKIRDGHATVNGDKTEYTMPSGCLDIIAEDGRALFCITLADDGGVDISASGHCRHMKTVLEDVLLLQPRSSNVIRVYRHKSEFAKTAP